MKRLNRHTGLLEGSRSATRSIIALFSLFLLVRGPAFAVGDETEARAAFQQATQLYGEENFAGASAEYAKLAEDWVSPEIFYNAGSAAYRVGDDGQAALWFKRALVLDSTFVEARQNLRFLRHKQGFLRVEPDPLDNFAGGLRKPVWLLLLVISGGMATVSALALAFLRVKVRFRAALIWVVVLGVLIAGVTATGYVAKSSGRDLLSTYVVTGTKVRALTAPSDSAGMVVALPPGSELSCLEQRGPWIYTDIPGGSRGWVRVSNLKKLWPYSSRLAE